MLIIRGRAAAGGRLVLIGPRLVADRSAPVHVTEHHPVGVDAQAPRHAPHRRRRRPAHLDVEQRGRHRRQPVLEQHPGNDAQLLEHGLDEGRDRAGHQPDGERLARARSVTVQALVLHGRRGADVAPGRAQQPEGRVGSRWWSR